MSEPRRPPRAALRSAKRGIRATALSLFAVLASCLVTNRVNYDQPIITAELVRREPMAEFLTVPVEPDEECVRTGAGEVPFLVEIKDLNIEDQLELRIMVNNTFVEDIPVPPTGAEDREPVRFCVRATTLDNRCNLVEALVSSNFDRSTQREPYHTGLGDLASVHWWVIGDSANNPSASYLDCPEPVPDAGSP